MHSIKRDTYAGFTIVELAIVIIVIAILASIVIVGYRGVQLNARNVSLLSDISAVESELSRNAVKAEGKYSSSLDWDSSTGPNSNIFFSPSSGNTIVVTTSVTAYCVKVFNPESSKKTLDTAEVKESEPGACTAVPPPADPYDIALSGTTYTANQIATICSSSSNAPSGYNLITSGGAYVNGTGGNDIIYLSSVFGYVYGNGGNDIMCLGSVTGYVYGNDGNDIIRVTSGYGYIYGGNGNDTLWSTGHTGYLVGDENDDVIYAHQGLGYAQGGNGFDRLNVIGGYTIPTSSIEELF